MFGSSGSILETNPSPVAVAIQFAFSIPVALVEREDQVAHEMGVTGVPAMIFGGKIAVSGAREPEMLAMAIDKALEMADKPEA